MTDPFKPSQIAQDFARVSADPFQVSRLDQSAAAQVRAITDQLRDPLRQAGANMSRISQMAAGMDLSHISRSLAGLDMSGISRVAAGLERQRSAIRDAMMSASNSVLGVQSSFKTVSENSVLAQAAFRQQFRTPKLYELSGLESAVASLRPSLDAVMGKDFRTAMETMRSPWLARHDSALSAAAFAELQSVGRMVNTLPPFSESLSSALRTSLGNWTAPPEMPEAIFIDPEARSSFYGGLGFNRALTNFPEQAFEESINIAGLTDETDHGEPDNGEEAPFERNVSAYVHIFQLETSVREFIHQMMSKAFGENWAAHQVPSDTYKGWLEKQEKARSSGEPEQPLINYADFTDYIKIIERRDNWNKVFKPVFGRLDDVRESFVRLFPIRIVTMHSRWVSLDDELLLRVEARRMLRAIRRG